MDTERITCTSSNKCAKSGTAKTCWDSHTTWCSRFAKRTDPLPSSALNCSDAKKIENALPLLEYIADRMTYKTTPKWLRWRVQTAVNMLKQ